MSGIKPMSRADMAVAVLIAAAAAIVIALLADFYFQWEMLETFGQFLLSWL